MRQLYAFVVNESTHNRNHIINQFLFIDYFIIIFR